MDGVARTAQPRQSDGSGIVVGRGHGLARDVLAPERDRLGEMSRAVHDVDRRAAATLAGELDVEGGRIRRKAGGRAGLDVLWNAAAPGVGVDLGVEGQADD